MIAQFHAAHLREHGIMAGVIDASVSAVISLYGGLRSNGQYELIIPTKRLSERAQELLEEIEANPPTIDEGWEDDVRPDLSLLDPKHVPDCPSCNTRLFTSRPLGPCFRCSAKYDMVELIFERSGPDALAGCYETAEPLANLSDAEVCAIQLDCASCSYPLDGLAISGACPECGAAFNRRELFVDLLG
tara:strand:- start:26589 stop:27152 length:564 start_codon:yes stop_codon:yes gene_type:complete